MLKRRHLLILVTMSYFVNSDYGGTPHQGLEVSLEILTIDGEVNTRANASTSDVILLVDVFSLRYNPDSQLFSLHFTIL